MSMLEQMGKLGKILPDIFKRPVLKARAIGATVKVVPIQKIPVEIIGLATDRGPGVGDTVGITTDCGTEIVGVFQV